ncbi:proline dehydrogenase family protein [Rhodocytophaga aerolata]|uniref:Proline dehydrogenase family protein n=1 Tax=Rhodocytophaga aerolata TaxID=455078 RepID=A0ABT8R025_9BACT|nr:proline dehydrogenase family protein [Rhodocytophaga aerolata]MDO1445016.1 proline dehydrogenase family protein [Rhodocytophaga aerolata]
MNNTYNTKTTVSFEDTATAFASKSDLELKKMHLLFAAMNSNALVSTGTFFMKAALKFGLPIKSPIKHTLFEQFCGGESIAECEDAIQELANYHIKTILDYSVEGEKTEAGFDATTQEILATIDRAKGDPNIPFSVFKVTGIAATRLLEKKQSDSPLSEAEKISFAKVANRVDTICKRAHENNVRIFIDGEESWIQETIDELAYEMMRKYNKEQPIIYNTFQMYLTASLNKLKDALHNAVMHNYYLGAKLVRGAYMEKEREEARRRGIPDPVQPDKESTDEDFDKALLFCMNEKQRIAICSGSHNEHSNYYLTVLMDKHGLAPNDSRVYFAQLYGMSDHISYNLAKAGYNVAKYVPYGPIESVMPYLFRRAEENTSIAGQSSREFNLIQKELRRRKAQAKAS